MENRESFPKRTTLLEAFAPGMEVTVCEETRVDLGPNSAVVFPAGTRLKEIAGTNYIQGDVIRQDNYIIVKSDNGFEFMLPHTEAQKIVVL